MTYQSSRPININYGALGRAPAKKYGSPRAELSKRVIMSRRDSAISASRPREAVRSAKSDYSGYSYDSRMRTANMTDAHRAQLNARRRAEAERALAARERELAAIKAYEKKVRREHAQALRDSRRAARREEKKKLKRAEAEILKREIKVERVKLPISFIVSVAVAFIMLMGVVFSFSEVSKSSTELSGMKYELLCLEDEAEKTGVALEKKNDLRVIEDTAKNEYMMVREDSVQKKYISLSEGDKIVLENKNALPEDGGQSANGGFLSGMLSSFASAFDDILDYFH